MNLPQARIIFLIILIFFFLKGLFYCFFIPPWEAPDEPGHVKYVLYLYHNKSFPSKKITLGIGHELVKSWKYQKKYILPKIQINSVNLHKNLFDRNNYQPENGIDNITGYPPLYYLYLLPFYIVSLPFSSYLSLIFLRIGSLLLGMTSLVIIYRLTKLLFPHSSDIPNLTIFLITLHPMFTFMSAVVNNDNMVICFFLLFLYLSIRFIIIPDTLVSRNILLVGFIAGLSTLTKPQMLVMVPLYCLLVLFHKQIQIKQKILAFLSVLLIPFTWYIFSSHSSLSFAMGSIYPHQLPLWQYPVSFITYKQPIGIFMSFWGFFGWLDVSMPKGIYFIFFIVLSVATIGWFIALKNKMIIWPEKLKGAAIFIGGVTSIYILAVFGYDILYFARTSHFALQGRYFLPVLFVIILFIIQGLMVYRKRLKQLLLTLIMCVFVISQILMYITISNYYYHDLVFISPLTKIFF